MRSTDPTILADDHEVTEEATGKSKWVDKEMDLILGRNPGEKSPKRLSSIDILTQTVATLCHEINNPLLAITLTTEILLDEDSHLPPEAVERVKRIEMAAEKIQAVIERLREIETVHYRDTAAGKMIRLG